MKKKFQIVESQLSGSVAKIYELKDFESDNTEFVEVMEFNNDQYPAEVELVVKQLDLMANKYGLLNSFFKYESKNIFALQDTENLRIYCIKVGSAIIILGGGGSKLTRTYQDDPNLNSQVELLKKIESILDSKLKSNQIKIFNDSLIGNLNIEIETD